MLGGTVGLTGERFADDLDRYDLVWSFQVMCSSGDHMKSAREADQVAYELADTVMDFIESDHTLRDLVDEVWIDAVDRIESWEDNQPSGKEKHNPLHTILVVSISVGRMGNQ